MFVEGVLSHLFATGEPCSTAVVVRRAGVEAVGGKLLPVFSLSSSPAKGDKLDRAVLEGQLRKGGGQRKGHRHSVL